MEHRIFDIIDFETGAVRIYPAFIMFAVQLARLSLCSRPAFADIGRSCTDFDALTTFQGAR